MINMVGAQISVGLIMIVLTTLVVVTGIHNKTKLFKMVHRELTDLLSLEREFNSYTKKVLTGANRELTDEEEV